MIKLDYINDSPYHINDDFTVFAYVISESKDCITAHRFMKYGKIDCGIYEFSRNDFNYFYRRCKPKEVILIGDKDDN